jgi:Tol biopolymer transport system component
MVVMMTASLLPAHATAPGENGRIAFRRYFNKAQTQGAIFTIRPNGTGERRLTHSPRSKLTTTPDWSPDGHWIVYNVWPLGDQNAARILNPSNGTGRMKIDGTGSSCFADRFLMVAERSADRLPAEHGSPGRDQSDRDLHDAG